MSTGTSFVDLGSEKRLLGRTDFDERFLSHLRTLVHESYERAYRTGVVFDTAIGLAADGADKFKLTGTSDATDGLGHDLNAATGGFETLIQFENTNAIIYQAALHYAEVPSGIQVNPRTGLPEYIGTNEQIGESADPDLVIDNGTNMTFVVDGVTESSVSNAGRTVRVFRKVPGRNATTMLVAVEDATVVWTGTQNRITTSGDLGQDVISTTASDYTVVLLGPTVKRNTVLLNVDGYTFIGKVTGAGAGNPPVTFDITDQDVVSASLSDLSDITRRDSHGFLKIDVKADASDAGEPQISVKNAVGTDVFTVDEAGNVVIQGTTTQQNFVQVNSSETITDNLTAGDVSGDSHLITGTWTHQPQGGGTPYFTVDGTTGRVGMGINPDPADHFTVADEIRIEGAAFPAVHIRESTVAVDAGGLWRMSVDSTGSLIWQRSNSGGNFTTAISFLKFDNSSVEVVAQRGFRPSSSGVWDLGTASFHWRDGYIDEIFLSTGAGQGLGTDLFPDVNLIRALGSTTRRFTEAHTRDLYLGTAIGEGVHTHLMPDTTGVRDLGSASARWQNLFVNNLSFAGDFLPAVDDTQDIGSSSLRWAEGHYSDWLSVGSATALVAGQSFNVVAKPAGNSTFDQSAVVQLVTNKTSAVGTDHTALYVTTKNIGVTFSEQTMRGVHYFLDWSGVASSTNVFHVGYDSGGDMAGGGSFTQGYAHYHVSDFANGPATFSFNKDHIGLHVEALTGTISGSGKLAAILVDSNDSYFGGDVLPLVDNGSDLGSTAFRWGTIRGERLFFGVDTVQTQVFSIQSPDPTLLVSAFDGGGYMSFKWNNAASTASRQGLQVRTDVDAHSTGFAHTGMSVSCNTSTPVTWTNNQSTLRLEVTNNTVVGTSGLPQGNVIVINANTQPVWCTDLHGILIGDMSGGTNSYSIRTGLGLVEFGDRVQPNVTDSIELGSASLRWDRVWHRKPWAYTYSTTTQVNTATWAFVAGGSTTAGDDITVNTANFQFTIVKAGVYRVSYGMPLGLFGSSGNVVQTAVTVNGTRQNQSYSRCGAHTSVGKNACVGSTLLNLAAGNVVRLHIQERTSADGVPAAFSTMGDTAASSLARRWMSLELVRYT